MDDKIQKAKEFLGDKYLLSPKNRVQRRVESRFAITMTELAHNAKDVVSSANHHPVAIYNHSRLVAYVISPEEYERLIK